MIPFSASLALSDHQDPELLLAQPYFALNSGLFRLPVLVEGYSHMGTLLLVALAGLAPCGHYEHMEECTLVDKQHPFFFGRVKLSHSRDSDLMLVPYLLSRSL